MSVYKSVEGRRPSRSVFNLTHDYKFDCDMGQLIPSMAMAMIPGDTFTVGNEIVIRSTPLLAPLFAEISAYVHYFFVPYRILCDNENDFAEFITGFDADANESSVSLPRWIPSNNSLYSLWDYFGFPVEVSPQGAYPLDFTRRAYNFIYNEFYRDENHIDEVDWTNENILYRAWHKDRFTSALPWQQKGVSPSFPLSGVLPVEFEVGSRSPSLPSSYSDNSIIGSFSGVPSSSNPYTKVYRMLESLSFYSSSSGEKLYLGGNAIVPDNANNTYISEQLSGASFSGSIDLQNAVTFDVSDLRLAFQIQRWMEKNARGGTRYTEFLMSHFGVSPRDSRLQRPQYLGGTKSAVMVSEVAQTSASADGSTPLGNLAGKGITASKDRAFKFTAPEFGIVIGIFSMLPKASYQQGIDREWLYDTKFDFPFPVFAHLSEQPVYNAEIYAESDDEEWNKGTFGFQPIYNELRHKEGKVVGGMRDKFDYWHLGRKFGNRPVLNADFINCVPSKRIFAVQDEPGFIVNMSNVVRAVRPIPKFGTPGLIDHN